MPKIKTAQKRRIYGIYEGIELYQSRRGFVYVPIVLDTKKKSSSGTQMLKNGLEQGLLRSLVDFGSPYLLYEIVVCWLVAR